MSSQFHSHESGEPFSHCYDCGCLLAEAEMYIVNQTYSGEECVFEFVLCMKCREKMQKKLSDKSRIAMFDFLHDHIDMEARKQSLGSDSDVEEYLSHCITCNQPRETISGYTIGAMFAQSSLIKGPFPMLMCSTCEESLAETISDETRKMWDDFIGELFPGPPSEVTLPTETKPVLL